MIMKLKILSILAHTASPVLLTKSGRPKRICRFPGCTNSIKSHGHCQTHGAKPKRCKVPECMSQRQSGFDDMCKRHFNEAYKKPKKTKAQERKVEVQGKSVYDDVLPRSFMWRGNSMFGTMVKKNDVSKEQQSSKEELADDAAPTNQTEYEFTTQMPLAKLLEDNATEEAGWHRRDECLARGLKPPQSLQCKLEEWEAQTAALEMALLVGIDGHSSSDEKYQRLLSHAWGRNENFKKNLIARVCSRRGDMIRKRRSDAGIAMSEEKKAAYKDAYSCKKRKKAESVEVEEQSEEEDLTELKSLVARVCAQQRNDGKRARKKKKIMADDGEDKAQSEPNTSEVKNSINDKAIESADDEANLASEDDLDVHIDDNTKPSTLGEEDD